MSNDTKSLFPGLFRQIRALDLASQAPELDERVPVQTALRAAIDNQGSVVAKY